MDIDDIIDFESEHTELDFKAIQYKKGQNHEFLKDVLGMANAITDKEKLIIVGVKKYPDKSFAVIPIPESEFKDASVYQQLVTENIEPDIQIEYNPHRYKGEILVGIFRIITENNRPYMMKKDFGNGSESRKKGESFIRKGETTFPLMRSDIDRIFEQRTNNNAFNHRVSAYFAGTNKEKTVTISPVSNKNLPSEREAKEIRKILKQRENLKRERQENYIKQKTSPDEVTVASAFLNLSLLPDVDNPFTLRSITGVMYGTSYEERSTQTLKENLKNIREIYKDDDIYELQENRAAKINFTLLNEGTKYLKDAKILIEIPKIEGLFVANALLDKPVSRDSLFGNPNIGLINSNKLFYSKHKVENNTFVYNQDLGDLPHLQPKEVFEVPIRIIAFPQLVNQSISINITLFGENLMSPLKYNLSIRVVDSQKII